MALFDRKLKLEPMPPSKLIKLALDDLRKVERDERYHIDFSQWHAPTVDVAGACAVCLAGAVLAKTLDVPPRLSITPFDLDDIRTRIMLRALDEFRCGYISTGLRSYHVVWPGVDYSTFANLHSVHVTPYRNNPEGFYRDMYNIVAMFERSGL